jgi:hypothetical protein
MSSKYREFILLLIKKFQVGVNTKTLEFAVTLAIKIVIFKPFIKIGLRSTSPNRIKTCLKN